MIDEKKLIEEFEAREMPAIDIIKEVINSQPKIAEPKTLDILQTAYNVAFGKWSKNDNEQEKVGLRTEMHYIKMGIRLLEGQLDHIGDSTNELFEEGEQE